MIKKVVIPMILVLLGTSLALSGQSDSSQTKRSSFKLAGKAAQQLMAMGQLEMVDCIDHSFRNPDTDQMIDAPYCNLKGQVSSVQPVYWFPRNFVGFIEVEFTGPAANELVKNGLHVLGQSPSHISCSQHAWAPGTGHCTAIIEAVDENTVNEIQYR